MYSILNDLNLGHNSQPTYLKNYNNIQWMGGPYYYRHGLGQKNKSYCFISRSDL
jgi:hypothetical protein